MFYKCKSLKKLPDFYILNLYLHNVVFKLTFKKQEINKGKMRILGKNFIENNRTKGGIIYNKNEYNLMEYFEDIDNNNNHKDIIKLLLYLDKSIDNISYMFCGCESLISINKINKLDYYILNNQS